MKDLKKIIDQHTVDGVTDWPKVEEQVNVQINAIVLKDTAKATEKAVQDFIIDLKIEGLEKPEQVKDILAKAKTGETKFAADLAKKQAEADALVLQVAALTGDKDHLGRKNSLLAAGVTDPDDLDYLLFNVGKHVDETTPWDKALETFKTEKPQYFVPAGTPGPTTGRRVGGVLPGAEKAGFEKILEEKYPGLKI